MTKTKLIAVVSGKGGVGKSTTVINLGMALNSFGLNTTIVDANLITPNLGVYLGVPILPVTLHDVVKGKKNISEAIYLHKSGTKVVPASISLEDAKRVNYKLMPAVLKKLRKGSDVVLLDTPAGLSQETLAPIKAADAVLIVVNPEIPSLTDGLKALKLCQELKKEVLGIVVNKTNSKNADISLKDIASMMEADILGVIPEDRSVKYSHAKKDAVVHTHPKSAAAIQYKKLAAELLGEHYEEEIYMHGSFMDALMRFFKIK